MYQLCWSLALHVFNSDVISRVLCTSWTTLVPPPRVVYAGENIPSGCMKYCELQFSARCGSIVWGNLRNECSAHEEIYTNLGKENLNAMHNILFQKYFCYYFKRIIFISKFVIRIIYIKSIIVFYVLYFLFFIEA